MQEQGEKLLNAILEIVSRGNTAEVKRTRDGLIVLEVRRKIVIGK